MRRVSTDCGASPVRIADPDALFEGQDEDDPVSGTASVVACRFDDGVAATVYKVVVAGDLEAYFWKKIGGDLLAAIEFDRQPARSTGDREDGDMIHLVEIQPEEE